MVNHHRALRDLGYTLQLPLVNVKKSLAPIFFFFLGLTFHLLDLLLDSLSRFFHIFLCPPTFFAALIALVADS